MGKIGLVLEGGGMRGLYTAGVLDVFIEHDFCPPVICGTSAGVTFGVNLPSRQRGRVVRYNTTYIGRKDFISLHSLLTTGNMINVDFAYGKLPCELDPFDQETYAASGVEFYATVTNLRTGEAEYMLLVDCYEQMDVIRASAALPFVSTKVKIGDDLYLDGGIVDNIPLHKCLECGCDKAILVLTHPAGFVRTGSMVPMARLFYPRQKKLIEALKRRNQRYNDCIAEIEKLEAEGKVFVIRPERDLEISRLESDPEKIRQTYELGFKDATQLWDRLQAFLEK